MLYATGNWILRSSYWIKVLMRRTLTPTDLAFLVQFSWIALGPPWKALGFSWITTSQNTWSISLTALGHCIWLSALWTSFMTAPPTERGLTCFVHLSSHTLTRST